MSWISKFKLGRPAYESVFELNPSAMTFEPLKIADFGRGLDASGIDLTLSSNRPRFTINGNYIRPEQANQFLSLLHITYEPLVFEPVDYSPDQVYEVWQERVIATSGTQFAIPENSFTRAGRLRQLNGGHAVIRPVGLWSSMNRAHGRTGDPLGPNLITPGLWGKILVEDFNLLPTGLLGNAGKNWLVSGGNGTTRDFFVSTTAPLEGAKELIATTDGTGTPITALRANGGLWNPTGVFAQRGFWAEFHTAEWDMQLVDNTTGTTVEFRTEGASVNDAWAVKVVVTGATTATWEWFHNGSSVAGPSVLNNPFTIPHTYKAIVTPTNVRLFVDITEVYNQNVATPFFNQLKILVTAAGGAPAGTVCKIDSIDINDGDGYDPSAKTFDITQSSPLVTGSPYWLTYGFNAIAVDLSAVPILTNGGWVDILRYNFTLQGM